MVAFIINNKNIWFSTNPNLTETLPPGKPSRATGNAQSAELKLPSFLLNQPAIDQSIAKSAGEIEGSKEISTAN